MTGQKTIKAVVQETSNGIGNLPLPDFFVRVAEMEGQLEAQAELLKEAAARIAILNTLLGRRGDEIRIWKEVAQQMLDALAAGKQPGIDEVRERLNDLLSRVSVVKSA